MALKIVRDSRIGSGHLARCRQSASSESRDGSGPGGLDHGEIADSGAGAGRRPTASSLLDEAAELANLGRHGEAIAAL